MARIAKWNDGEGVELWARRLNCGKVDIVIADEGDALPMEFYSTREDWEEFKAHVDGLFAAMENKEGGES